ncbi:MAG: hypothetical protein ABI460_12685 [Caldimonas sp.]
MNLDQFSELRQWHLGHLREQPFEKHAWDMVLTLWLAGWVGAPAAFLIHAGWALVLCGALLFLPSAYVALRRALHSRGVLRCDWIRALRRP